MEITRRRTQSERRRGSEERLLKAAIEIVAAQGMAAVTFEAIGRASELSRGLVTHRFGSKQKLIEGMLLYLHDDQARWLDPAASDALSGLDAILDHVRLCLSRIRERVEARAYFVLLSSSVAELAGSSAFRATHAEMRERLEAWVRRGQAEGGIRPAVDASAASLMIGCLLFGTAMQMLVDPATDPAALADTILDTLRRSLAG